MNLRRAFILIGLIGATAIIMTSLDQLPAFWRALSAIHWYLIPLLIITQLASYWANAGYYRDFFAMTGRDVGRRKLYELSLAVNFANQVIPAGGVAGTTLLAHSLKHEVPSGQVTLAQLGRYGFSLFAYAAVLGLGFVWLFFGGNINRISVRLVALLILIILAIALVIIMLISDRRRLEAVLLPVLRTINNLSQRWRHQTLIDLSKIDRFLDEFYDAFRELRRHRRARRKLWYWSLGYDIIEVVSVYVVFLGFGININPGVVIAGYTLAIIASVAGFLTSGIGVYELGMVGTFTALGQPLSTSVAIVLVYRVLSLILFLPPGAYYYRKYLRDTPAANG